MFGHRGRRLSLDVGQVIVELAQVVVVLLVVQGWEDAAAGELWQILETQKSGNVRQFHKRITLLHFTT